MHRRTLLKTLCAAGAYSLLNHGSGFANQARSGAVYFSLHPFIEAHPEAVFIKRTNISVKTDSQSKRQAGFELAKEIFMNTDSPGIPLSHRYVIKPNLTKVGTVNESSMGIITDCDFVEGIIQGLKGTGISSGSIYIREGNWLKNGGCGDDWEHSPYKDMAERTGVHLLDFPSGRKAYEIEHPNLQDDSEVMWFDCPDGVVFKRIGYVAPFNQSGTWLLNIAKFKAHGMGLTLCVKNLQGACIPPHVHFCEGIDTTLSYENDIRKDFQPEIEENIEELYGRHAHAGIPRWDRPGRTWNSGFGMETWAQRTCDSISLTNTGLNIIEGIYGRNGNGFMSGPGPDNTAQDFMTNVVFFGKNPFTVDIIGHYLGGHEPGNFGLFHCAYERNLCDTINPNEIPVYEWENGTPVLKSLADFERTPLLTYYLQRDYNGYDEPLYHLVNEPFDYGAITSVNEPVKPVLPDSYVLAQNYPNPFNSATIIEYSIPKDGRVRIEVFNAAGQLVDVVVDEWKRNGSHMLTWDASRFPSGVYFYRFIANNVRQTKKLTILR